MSEENRRAGVDAVEVLTVGLPFCVFKIATGLWLSGGGATPLAEGVGACLVLLGAVDGVLNAVNLVALAAFRRRVFDACVLSFAARLFRLPARKPRWTLQDFGNSLDVLLSFGLVASMVGAGKLGELSGGVLALWNLSVVANVLGAGLTRFSDSFRNLSARTAAL